MGEGEARVRGGGAGQRAACEEGKGTGKGKKGGGRRRGVQKRGVQGTVVLWRQSVIALLPALVFGFRKVPGSSPWKHGKHKSGEEGEPLKV